jgi:hypothetical protein
MEVRKSTVKTKSTKMAELVRFGNLEGRYAESTEAQKKRFAAGEPAA